MEISYAPLRFFFSCFSIDGLFYRYKWNISSFVVYTREANNKKTCDLFDFSHATRPFFRTFESSFPAPLYFSFLFFLLYSCRFFPSRFVSSARPRFALLRAGSSGFHLNSLVHSRFLLCSCFARCSTLVTYSME